MKRKLQKIFFLLLFVFSFSQIQDLTLFANSKKTTIDKKEIESLIKKTVKELQLEKNIRNNLKKDLKQEINSKFFLSLFLFFLTGALAILFLYFERKKLIYDLSSKLFRRITFYQQERINQKIDKTIKEQALVFLKEEIKRFLEANQDSNLLSPPMASLSRLESSINDLSSQVKAIKGLSPNLLFVGDNYLRQKNYQTAELATRSAKPTNRLLENSTHLSLVGKSATKNNEHKQKLEPVVKRKRGRPPKNSKIKNDKLKEDLNFEEIKNLILKSNFEQASLKIEAMKANFPNYSIQEKGQILFLNSILEHKRENYSKALNYIENSLELDPYFIEAWNHQGILLDQLGKHKEAIECYKKAIQLKSTLGSDKIIV